MGAGSNPVGARSGVGIKSCVEALDDLYVRRRSNNKIKWYPSKNLEGIKLLALGQVRHVLGRTCVYGGRDESSCFHLEGINFEPEIFFKKSYIISSLDAFLGYMYFVFSFP